jgi:large subunit ribosomal protein L32
MLPVQKHSKSRKRKRRAHQALKPIHYVRCPQCGNSKLPHCACDNCGYVNPKLIRNRPKRVCRRATRTEDSECEQRLT